MIMLTYAAIAIVFLLSVLGWIRRRRPSDSGERPPDNHFAPSSENGRWLDLSERIFDPSDARWLAEELAFPKLAEELVLERKRMAVRWLETLKESFNEIVRTPALTAGELPEVNSRGSWHMLWLTLRFQLLVSYALLLVRVFGPYHRLIPSVSWFPFLRERKRSFQRPALANSRNSR